MAADMRAIEDMLLAYSERLGREAMRRSNACIGQPLPTTSKEERERLAELAAVQTDIKYALEVHEAHVSLAKERREAEWALFAGPWLPTDPIDAAMLRNTILNDIDALPECYLRREDWEEGGDPLFATFDAINTEMRTWRPKTRRLATAIALAVDHDERSGCGGDWPDAVVNRAQKLAMTDLPRPR